MGCDPEFESVLAWFDSSQCALCGLEHSRHLAVNIGVHVLAALALLQFKFERYGIAFVGLAGSGRDDFDGGACRGREEVCRSMRVCRAQRAPVFAVGSDCGRCGHRAARWSETP